MLPAARAFFPVLLCPSHPQPTTSQANRGSSPTCYGQVYGREMLLASAVSVLSFGRLLIMFSSAMS